MSDRRASERLPAEQGATLVYGKERIPAVLVNLSLGGAQLQCPAGCSLVPGAPCTLELSDGRDGQELRLEAEVVWSYAECIGVALSWLAPAQRYYLNRLLSALAQQSLGGMAVC